MIFTNFVPRLVLVFGIFVLFKLHPMFFYLVIPSLFMVSLTVFMAQDMVKQLISINDKINYYRYHNRKIAAWYELEFASYVFIITFGCIVCILICLYVGLPACQLYFIWSVPPELDKMFSWFGVQFHYYPDEWQPQDFRSIFYCVAPCTYPIAIILWMVYYSYNPPKNPYNFFSNYDI